MPLHKINAHTTRKAGVLVNAEHSLRHSLSPPAHPSLSFSCSFVQLILLAVCINHFGFFFVTFFLLRACWCLSVLKKTSRLRILARLFRIFVPFFCVALRLNHVKEERKKGWFEIQSISWTFIQHELVFFSYTQDLLLLIIWPHIKDLSSATNQFRSIKLYNSLSLSKIVWKWMIQTRNILMLRFCVCWNMYQESQMDPKGFIFHIHSFGHSLEILQALANYWRRMYGACYFYELISTIYSYIRIDGWLLCMNAIYSKAK